MFYRNTALSLQNNTNHRRLSRLYHLGTRYDPASKAQFTNPPQFLQVSIQPLD